MPEITSHELEYVVQSVMRTALTVNRPQVFSVDSIIPGIRGGAPAQILNPEELPSLMKSVSSYLRRNIPREHLCTVPILMNDIREKLGIGVGKILKK